MSINDFFSTILGNDAISLNPATLYLSKEKMAAIHNSNNRFMPIADEQSSTGFSYCSVPYVKKETCFSYQDDWYHFHYYLQDSLIATHHRTHAKVQIPASLINASDYIFEGNELCSDELREERLNYFWQLAVELVKDVSFTQFIENNRLNFQGQDVLESIFIEAGFPTDIEQMDGVNQTVCQYLRRKVAQHLNDFVDIQAD